eukprot:TRINITY_DN12567_c0_g1_i1.p1 TRINITY_DN12567_c0_g1~~TRINITY_DN12567_c0_g1_i1.p1  ORF type:complete len:184 (-),score=48.55 TRINITY_DN12567_c0_g1_i1:57-566(-)
MSSFGEKELRKFGWREGKGLGIAEDGITEPIRVTVKGDTKGVGYQQQQYTEEFDNEWWKQAYNTSADSVVVNNECDDVVIDRKVVERRETVKRVTGFVAEGECSERGGGIEIRDIDRVRQESELISLYNKNEASKNYKTPGGKQKRIAEQEARMEKKRKTTSKACQHVN